jgi:hypothetical protein
LIGLTFVSAICFAPLAGCSETSGTGGSGGLGGNGGDGGSAGMGGGGVGGDGGTGGTDLCEGVTCEDTECKADGVCDPADGICDFVFAADGTACSEGECLEGVCAPVGAFPCTEEGIRDAIAEGGGPHFFACDGSTPIVTVEIIIDNDVVLDGQGNLTVDGSERNRVFSVPAGVTAELRGITVTRGAVGESNGGGIRNEGTLTLVDTTVSQSSATCSSNCYGLGIGGGIWNSFEDATMTLINCTVSGNTARFDGGGIWNGGTMTLTNTTVSGNAGLAGVGGLLNDGFGTMTLVSSTISGDDFPYQISNLGRMSIANSLVDGLCSLPGISFLSLGYNIESPGDTCRFDQAGDQANVSTDDLKLADLADNGGPTDTHALGEGSAAIDQIPAEDCVDAEGEPLTMDQRGVERPQGDACDVGAVEVEVTP